MPKFYIWSCLFRYYWCQTKNLLKLFKITVLTLQNASHFFLLRSYLAQITASMIRENPSKWAGGVITTSYFGKTTKRK